MIDIVNYFHTRTHEIISKIKIHSTSRCYMRLSVLESLKSVFLYIKRDYLSKKNKKPDAPWLTSENKINCFLEYILKKASSLVNISEHGQNNEIRNFISICKAKFIEEFCQKSKSIEDVNRMCNLLSDICIEEKIDYQNSEIWDEITSHNNPVDEYETIQLLEALYTFLQLLCIYCLKPYAEIYNLLSNEAFYNDPHGITEAERSTITGFYLKSTNYQIQFFLPIEAHVTLSYFIYRYILPVSLSIEIGNEWSMGNKQEKEVPSSFAQLITILKGESENYRIPQYYKPIHAWIDNLTALKIFSNDTIDTIEKVKVLHLVELMRNGCFKGAKKIDITKFFSDPDGDYFRDSDMHVITDKNSCGTVLLSELMKEMEPAEIFTYTDIASTIAFNIKLIKECLTICYTSNFYDLRNRLLIPNAIRNLAKNSNVYIKSYKCVNNDDPILSLFVKSILYKTFLSIHDKCNNYIAISEIYGSDFITVYPDFDDSREEQRKDVYFSEVNLDSFREYMNKIEIKFESQNTVRSELNKLDNFFRIYFPEKYFVENRCTLLDYIYTYEVLNITNKQNGLVYKYQDVFQKKVINIPIRKLFAAKSTPQMETFVRAFTTYCIESHNMASNNCECICTFAFILDQIKKVFMLSENDYQSLDEALNASNQLLEWIIQLGRYLFGRSLDGLYSDDFEGGRERLSVEPKILKILDEFFDRYKSR